MFSMAILIVSVTALASIWLANRKVGGVSLGLSWCLIIGAGISYAASEVGVVMPQYQQFMIKIMIWSLTLSLLAIGLRAGPAIASLRSFPVLVLALLIVAVEVLVPYGIGTSFALSNHEIGALASNAAAITTLMSLDSKFASNDVMVPFAIRYLIQMVFPMIMLSLLFRRAKDVEHHSSACHAYQLATSPATGRLWRIESQKDMPMAAIMAHVHLQRVYRGGSELAPENVAAIAPADLIEFIADEEVRDRVMALVGGRVEARDHLRSNGLFLVLGLGLLTAMLSVHVGGIVLTVGVPIGVLVAALTAGWLGSNWKSCAIDLHQPLAITNSWRTIGLVVFLSSTGLALGWQAHLSSPHQILIYGGIALTTTLACWLTAIYAGRLILYGSPPMRAIGVLAGATTSSGLAESASARTGSEVAAQAFAIAYPLGSLVKVAIVQYLVLR